MTQTSDQPARPTLTGQDIAEAQGALRALLDRTLAGSGVNSDGYIVLRVLALRGPAASPAAFHDYLVGQRQLGLDLPAAADLLGDLESEGLISGSAVDDPGPLQLTDRGAARHADLAASLGPGTRQVFGGLDPDELAVAHRVLVHVAKQAEQVR
jgi:hypothetical protein